ncbi:hypothetical protein MUCCIDRAFT_107171 [Mucor lusitanicus CBS 277.49]|uniref:Uncharacterized protein n=1 Tax=Mucor lusitanicus CBS 277.49 TaxID=747725 RepID=A0A168NQI6_MUCCL|nr:hypothetical protein MUCCIDRAFT_107171 [Mucor lusitanicus CBS 277.49]
MVPQDLKVVLKAMLLSSQVSQVCPVSLWLVAKQHLSFTGLLQCHLKVFTVFSGGECTLSYVLVFGLPFRNASQVP